MICPTGRSVAPRSRYIYWTKKSETRASDLPRREISLNYLNKWRGHPLPLSEVRTLTSQKAIACFCLPARDIVPFRKSCPASCDTLWGLKRDVALSYGAPRPFSCRGCLRGGWHHTTTVRQDGACRRGVRPRPGLQFDCCMRNVITYGRCILWAIPAVSGASSS